MPTRPNDQAFPCPAVVGGPDAIEHRNGEAGLTIREYAAVQIMAGMLGSPDFINSAPQAADMTGERVDHFAARMAVMQADALIEALSAKEKPDG